MLSLTMVSFNPCSYGSFVLTYWTMTKEQYLAKFQSLFLWIFRSYLLDDNKRAIFTEVSILVLMDLSFLPFKYD